MISIDDPIFISGHTRSGTNILMRLMDGAPRVIFPPGEGKLNILRRFFSKPDIKNKIASNKDTIFSNIELNLSEQESDTIKKIISRKICHSDQPHGIYTILVLILESLAEYKSLDIATETYRWLEKNHNLEFYFGRACALFGNPKLLFVARDPLDNWASWKEYCYLNGICNTLDQAKLNISSHFENELIELSFGINRFENADHMAEYYKIKSSTILNFLVDLNARSSASALSRCSLDMQAFCCMNHPEGRFAWNYRIMYEKAASLSLRYPDNVLLVRYEDMVINTESCMRKILEFCGLETSSINLIPTDNGLEWFGNSSYMSPLKHKGVSNLSVGRGIKRLTLNEINNINLVLAGLDV